MKTRALASPLLDRFLGQAKQLDLETFSNIVLRDVEELLNTRLSSPLGETGGAAYGLPDLTLAGRGEGELLKLAFAVRHCLETYEPRLLNIRVEARPPEPVEIDSLTVFIEARLAGFEKEPPLLLELPVSIRRNVW